MKKIIPVLSALTGFFISSSHAIEPDFDSVMEFLQPKDTPIVIYLNVDGDFNKAGAFLTDIYLEQLKVNPKGPPIPVDFSKVFNRIGLSQLDSMALTSSPYELGGYENKSIIVFEGEPTGLLAIWGKENFQPSVGQSIPADVDFVSNFRFVASELLTTIRGIFVDMMGPMGDALIQQQLSQPITEDGLTIAQLIQEADHKILMAFRLNPEADTSVMPAAALLGGNIVLQIENFYPTLQRLSGLLQSKGFVVDAENPNLMNLQLGTPFGLDTVEILSNPESGQVTVAVNSTSLDWLDSESPKLASLEKYQELMKGLPVDALATYYMSERYTQFQLESMLSPQVMNSKYGNLVEMVSSFLQPYVGAQAGSTYFHENSMYSVSRQPVSTKTALGLFGMGLPVGIYAGFEAAKAEEAEAAAAVSDDPVYQNLQNIAIAAQMYMIDNEVESVSFIELREYDETIAAIEPVFGEDYSDIVVTAETTAIDVVLEDGTIVTFAF